ncbi:MAG: carboxypeptidase-like regulatory domain-containing protein [Gemmatimonadota bacterium]|mgnify:CR=1 FL=1|nr:carboxypeptidase-like regulatory domain-containing protein [Gemmatimonadota bacterium]
MKNATWTLAIVLGAMLLPGAAEAQTPPSIRGRVLDTGGRPLEGVEILLAGVARSVSTNAAGRFVFDSLSTRDYALTARLPGYGPARTRVAVKSAPPTEVELRMEPRPQVLETIVVEGIRRGLYGVVSDSARQPVVGARVDVHGGGTSQLTDTTGRFAFPELKGGDYTLVASQNGRSGHPLYVTVPNRGAIEVVLFATRQDGPRDPPEMYWIYHDMGVRLWRYPANTHMNGEELRRSAGKRLCDIPRLRSVVNGDLATVVLNGVEVLFQWSLCEIDVDEVGMIEWAEGCVSRGQPIKLPPALRTRGSGSRGQQACLMVWTRE